MKFKLIKFFVSRCCTFRLNYIFHVGMHNNIVLEAMLCEAGSWFQPPPCPLMDGHHYCHHHHHENTHMNGFPDWARHVCALYFLLTLFIIASEGIHAIADDLTVNPYNSWWWWPLPWLCVISGPRPDLWSCT
jgi:hypothetical protein